MKETKRAYRTSGEWQFYWRFEDGKATGSIFSLVRPGHAYCIAKCPQFQTQEQWEADAGFIVCAVNAHDALLAACKAALPKLSESDDYARDLICAAIAAAESK